MIQAAILGYGVVGSGVAGALSTISGCASPAPHGGLFVFPVMHNVLGYLLSLAAGSPPLQAARESSIAIDRRSGQIFFMGFLLSRYFDRLPRLYACWGYGECCVMEGVPQP